MTELCVFPRGRHVMLVNRVADRQCPHNHRCTSRLQSYIIIKYTPTSLHLSPRERVHQCVSCVSSTVSRHALLALCRRPRLPLRPAVAFKCRPDLNQNLIRLDRKYHHLLRHASSPSFRSKTPTCHSPCLGLAFWASLTRLHIVF